MSQEPIFAASLALFVGEEVLLIQRARPPLKGYWTLPGGRVEPGERAETAMRREISEELGFFPPPAHMVQRFAAQPGFEICVFTARLDQLPAIRPNEEIADHRLSRINTLGGLQLSPGLVDILAQARAILRKEAHPMIAMRPPN